MKTSQTSLFLLFIYILFAGLLTVFIHYTFAAQLPVWLIWLAKFGLPILFGSIWYLARKSEKMIFSKLNLPFFVLNLGMLVTFLLASRIENLLNLDSNSAHGLALIKLNECIILSVSIIITSNFFGLKPADIFLSKGKLWMGLIIGILCFSVMVTLGLIQPGQNAFNLDFLLKFAPWLLIFVFANAFMEELMFRGLFLYQLSLPNWAANLVTTLFFTAGHMTVTYTPDILQFLVILLVLSFLWGFFMQKTQSIIASVIFHAGADVAIMYGVFMNFGINTL